MTRKGKLAKVIQLACIEKAWLRRWLFRQYKVHPDIQFIDDKDDSSCHRRLLIYRTSRYVEAWTRFVMDDSIETLFVQINDLKNLGLGQCRQGVGES